RRSVRATTGFDYKYPLWLEGFYAFIAFLPWLWLSVFVFGFFFPSPDYFSSKVRMSSRSSSSSNSLPESSHTVEAMNPSPQVVSRSSGNPRLVVVGSSPGRVALGDSRVAEALVTMKSCFNSDST
ncbi:hypothetical protein BHE74_00029831, partial [Ensete ventricosum]